MSNQSHLVGYPHLQSQTLELDSRPTRSQARARAKSQARANPRV